MSNPNQLTPRAQERFARIEKYLASGLSQKALQFVIEFSHGVIIRLSGPVNFALLAQLIHSTAV